ncbi:MAG: hypothetical protein GX936_07780, partial [Clostridiales bacterium]|nr:hypothetical protein [Clostridiales bacterium]
MAIELTHFLITLLLFFGLKTICAAVNGHSFIGRRMLRSISKWQRKPIDAWAIFPLKQFSSLITRLVNLDEDAAQRLRRNLLKADLTITPQEYSARKYIIITSGVARWR